MVLNELNISNKLVVASEKDKLSLFNYWFLQLKAVLSQEENTAKLRLFAPKLTQEIVLEFLDSSIFKDYFAKKIVEEFRKNLRGIPEGNFKEAVFHALSNINTMLEIQRDLRLVFFPELTREKIEELTTVIDFVAEVFKEFDNRQKGVGIVKI